MDIDIQDPEGPSTGGPCRRGLCLAPIPRGLRERIVGRGLDPPEVIQRRLTNAKKEIEEAHRYGDLILNEGLEEAVKS